MNLPKLNKDVRVMMKQLINDGWVLKRSKKHLVFNKNNRTLVLSKSPSDMRALKNSLRDAQAFSGFHNNLLYQGETS